MTGVGIGNVVRAGALLAAVSLVCGGCVDSSAGANPTSADTSDPAGVSLRDIDGGTDFYSRFDRTLPSDPTFFPIAVWSESVVDDTGWPVEKEAGINVYLQPTEDSKLDLIADKGMYTISSTTDPDAPTSGYFTEDEVDMWAGPGDADTTGNSPGQGDICIPADAECGYTVMKRASEQAPSGSLRVSNYGKGVVFWESDDEAKRFVNEFQDVVSADVYWFTDPNVCGPSEGGALLGQGDRLDESRCRLAANYGKTVERVRSLLDPPRSAPVWNFVEVGHPFSEDDAPDITGREIRAAVWHSLIAGARGIVYFVHNFAGPCPTQHAIRDCGPQLQSTIAAVDREVASLAPVLNGPFVDGLVTADERVALSTKLHDGSLYVLAGSATAEQHSATITVGCEVGAATVVGEDRTLPIVDGRFTDNFADGNAVHIYRIDGAQNCVTV